MDSLLNAYVTWQEHTVSLTVWFSCFSFKSFSTNQTVWSFCIDINRLDWSFYVTFCVTYYHHDSINNQSNKFWSLTGFGLLFECRFKFQFVKSVRIRKYSGPHFSHLNWIRRDIPYLSVFSPNAGKYWPE